MKTCSTCKIEKKAVEFGKDKRHKDGLESACRKCDNARGREYNSTHKKEKKQYRINHQEKIKEAREQYYTTHKKIISIKERYQKYGKNSEELNQLFIEQGKRCAVCGTTKPSSIKGWQVDHSHKSRKVRGILCHLCNTGLGCFQDNSQILQKAIQYLSK